MLFSDGLTTIVEEGDAYLDCLSANTFGFDWFLLIMLVVALFDAASVVCVYSTQEESRGATA